MDALVSEEMEGICVMPDMTIKTEQTVGAMSEEAGTQNVAMGIKFILPNRFDMNVCSRFVKSLNEEDSKNIQDQVNSDLEVASVLFKGKNRPGEHSVAVYNLTSNMLSLVSLYPLCVSVSNYVENGAVQKQDFKGLMNWIITMLAEISPFFPCLFQRSVTSRPPHHLGYTCAMFTPRPPPSTSPPSSSPPHSPTSIVATRCLLPLYWCTVSIQRACGRFTL
jgi:hypothetical protein